MEIVYIAVMIVASAAAGYLFAAIGSNPPRQQPTAEHPDRQQYEPKILKQYRNFFYYDGTGKGQIDIEDKN